MKTLTTICIVALVLGYTTLATAQVPSGSSLSRQMTERVTKIAGKLKRTAWREHLAGKKARWLAALAIPVMLNTAPIAAAGEGDFSPASMDAFSQRNMLQQVAQGQAELLPRVQYQQEQYQQAEEWEGKSANGRSVVLYLGSGVSQTPGMEGGSYWTAIHGNDDRVLEQAGSVYNLGIGLRNPRETTHELKLFLFNSTAGEAAEEAMREGVAINGDSNAGLDWIAAWTFQLFGVDRGGIVGPFRYAPLSVNIGSALRSSSYYAYEQTVSGRDDAFTRTSGRKWMIGGIWQANLDLINVGNSVLGVNYLGASSSLPANKYSFEGFTHLVTMSLRHGW